MCNNWPDFPISVYGATGGLVGDTVIICGGDGGPLKRVDECYSLTSEKATIVTHMSVGRDAAASVVLNDDTLWITGGLGNGQGLTLASTEYVTVTETMPGPDLPIALFHHAMVAINRTCSMVIGGKESNGSYSASTHYYDRNQGEWFIGPSLMQSRIFHAAGIVTDEVTDDDFVAVTGGNYHSDFTEPTEGGFHIPDYFDSTEILQDGKWVQGKIIFWNLSGPKILL